MYVRRRSGNESREKELRGITVLISLVIWTLGIVFLLDNLGFKISAVITGLGIGGIAVALAAQAILGDLFAYFVIFFDRPFEIGDFITVTDKAGSVEYIGLKTTRLRSLSGEQLVFSNKDLTDSRIHNYKRMMQRRIVFQLGVTYQTTQEKIKEIPGLVKQIIEKQPDISFDRGHFAKYGDFSLIFEFVYYVVSPDYNRYMDIQQAIYFDIYKEFEQRGIEFAYPTQTLFIPSQNNNSEKGK
jgi:small-conductance mechanosensitive channel